MDLNISIIIAISPPTETTMKCYVKSQKLQDSTSAISPHKSISDHIF
jgi:hypothetical protein